MLRILRACDDQKHHQASPSGQAVERPARNGERLHSTRISDHELTHRTFQVSRQP